METRTILSPELSLRVREVWKLITAPLTIADLGQAMKERWGRKLSQRRFRTKVLFSPTETRHQVQTGNDIRYTRCALDALILLQIMGRGARLRTSCPHCGEGITVADEGGSLRFSHPQAVLSWGFSRQGRGPAPRIACPFINLFPSRQHYQDWAEAAGEAVTIGLNLEEVNVLLQELAGESQ